MVLGWRSKAVRRFRGRREMADGADALGGGSGARCRCGVSGSASEHKRPRSGGRAPLPGREKEKGAVERRARPFRFWEERGREHELCLAALDARGVGRRAREDDAGDDCKKDGDC
uniref:DUF834 domain-containing protein n=1 Tax=Oryza rufipogon TaxID=4529 RepID=A0A0E0PCW3_ORYRU